jgi:rifampicin phosphotransferase
MTDPLTPLFRTFGLDCINTSLSRLMDGFMGDVPVLPDEPIIAVNQYAYYNGSVKFKAMFKILLNVRGIMKRMLTGAVERWTEDGRPRYLQTIQTWEASKETSGDWQGMTTSELLQAAKALAEAAIDAYGALVSGVIPAAWMSEAWFTLAYRRVRRKDDPPAPAYLMGYDSLPILAEKSLYDLAIWTRENTRLAESFEQTPTEQLVTHIQSDTPASGAQAGEWKEWLERFNTYLQAYGAMIYNLDFGNPLPADEPSPVVETLKLFLSGEGANPHERQQASTERREQAAENVRLRLKGRKLKSFEKNLARAQKFAPLREDGLAEVGLSYPLLRQVFGELGRRFVQGGMISQAGDIFWLEKDEVEAGAERLARGESLAVLHRQVAERKAVLRAARSVAPPMGLFQVRLSGRTLLRMKLGGAKERKGKTLKGVAASPGSVTAPACVLHGPQDFAMMKTGDVLVASLTTPAWTPLFARASAVVTDIGGPLSHGSIVAREYGIPAVLGTDTATRRIRSGQTITVDGNKGVVVVG